MSNDERFWATTDPVDGTRWRIDVAFTDSTWTCLWGRGCAGILDEPSAELGQGCCSVGAQLLDDDERRRIAALGASLNPARFQYAKAAATDGLFADEGRTATRVVDGACIFLNRPGFAGGEGCALHLGAVDDDESPIDWKPSVCWQLPLKVDVDADGGRVLRRWTRADWGDGGDSMAWCCTEQPGADSELPDAYVGEQPVAISLNAELSGLVGPELAAVLRQRAEGGGASRHQPPRPEQTSPTQDSSMASSQSDQ